MSEKLLPCPLCGGCPVLTEAMTEHWVSCGTCGASGGMHGRLKLAIAAWNRRTPAPEGEVVKSYGQKGRALYEAFWARNGDASPPPWDEQARAIRDMWVNIARDAEPLYASPVVPVGSGEVIDREWLIKIIREHSFAQDAADFIIEALRQPVVPVGVSEEQRAKIELVLIGYRNRITTLDAATDAIIAALRPTDTGWRDIATANRGHKVIIYDPRWGVTEGLMMDDGTWGLATFNGQIMKASPTHWMPLPPAPTDTGRE